jgi:cation:H+ antiporter
MENFSLLPIVLLFIVSGVVTWMAGVTLTKTTDSLDTRFKLGDALGGLVLLGISGSLPELAITISAAIKGHIPIIVGNLLGGVAIQTLIIVVFDFFAVKKKKPLSYQAGSPMLSFEILFAIIITAIVVMATFIPLEKNIYNFNPLSVVIVFAWVAGLFTINRLRKISKLSKTASDAEPGRKHHERRKVENHAFYKKKSNWRVILIFICASIATLIAGVLLEETGSAIAAKIGISSGIFAATAIAFVAALPEISTGLESVFIGDNHLAVSDIMGGNAFMLTFFFLAELILGKPVLSNAGKLDIFLGVLGILMMGVYAVSFLLKIRHRFFRLGVDSYLEIGLYALGLFVLVHFT